MLIKEGVDKMFSRETLKNRAKNILSKTYWMAFLACFLSLAITYGIRYTFDRRWDYHPNFSLNYGFTPFHNLLNAFVFSIVSFAALALFAVGILYSIFLSFPIVVGKMRFFLRNRRGETDLAGLFYAFKGYRYLDIVKSMAWRFLFQCLWLLLFIIPGIVKYYVQHGALYTRRQSEYRI